MPVTIQHGHSSQAKHLLAILVMLLALGGTALAQWGWQRMPPRFLPDQPGHRDFTFSRGLYRSDRREPGGQGWHTDYPSAAQNLMVRLSELTTTRVGWDPRDSPDHIVVTLSDAKILDYPFLFMLDVGTLWLTDGEIVRLREYLLKEGFLWVDDFSGPHAWEQWVREIGKVLPASEYPILDILLDHPIHKTMFEVTAISKIPSIQH